MSGSDQILEGHFTSRLPPLKVVHPHFYADNPLSFLSRVLPTSHIQSHHPWARGRQNILISIMSRLVDPRELVRENQDLVQENKELTTVNMQLMESNHRVYQWYVQKCHRIDNLDEQRSQDEEDLKKLREQCAKLESQNTGLRQDLQKCKDDLFRLQPASQVPDSEISDQYEALSNAISDWVDSEVARSADAWQKDNGNEPPQIFHHSEINHLEEILALYPESGGEYVLRFAIFNFLHRELFDENIFLFGLRTSDRECLTRTISAMVASQPSKGKRKFEPVLERANRRFRELGFSILEGRHFDGYRCQYRMQTTSYRGHIWIVGIADHRAR